MPWWESEQQVKDKRAEEARRRRESAQSARERIQQARSRREEEKAAARAQNRQAEKEAREQQQRQQERSRIDQHRQQQQEAAAAAAAQREREAARSSPGGRRRQEIQKFQAAASVARAPQRPPQQEEYRDEQEFQEEMARAPVQQQISAAHVAKPPPVAEQIFQPEIITLAARLVDMAKGTLDIKGTGQAGAYQAWAEAEDPVMLEGLDRIDPVGVALREGFLQNRPEELAKYDSWLPMSVGIIGGIVLDPPPGGEIAAAARGMRAGAKAVAKLGDDAARLAIQLAKHGDNPAFLKAILGEVGEDAFTKAIQNILEYVKMPGGVAPLSGVSPQALRNTVRAAEEAAPATVGIARTAAAEAALASTRAATTGPAARLAQTVAQAARTGGGTAADIAQSFAQTVQAGGAVATQQVLAAAGFTATQLARMPAPVRTAVLAASAFAVASGLAVSQHLESQNLPAPEGPAEGGPGDPLGGPGGNTEDAIAEAMAAAGLQLDEAATRSAPPTPDLLPEGSYGEGGGGPGSVGYERFLRDYPGFVDPNAPVAPTAIGPSFDTMNEQWLDEISRAEPPPTMALSGLLPGERVPAEDTGDITQQSVQEFFTRERGFPFAMPPDEPERLQEKFDQADDRKQEWLQAVHMGKARLTEQDIVTTQVRDPVTKSTYTELVSVDTEEVVQPNPFEWLNGGLGYLTQAQIDEIQHDLDYARVPPAETIGQVGGRRTPGAGGVPASQSLNPEDWPVEYDQPEYREHWLEREEERSALDVAGDVIAETYEEEITPLPGIAMDKSLSMSELLLGEPERPPEGGRFRGALVEEEGIRVGNRIYTDDEAGRKRAFDAYLSIVGPGKTIIGGYGRTEADFDRWLEASGGFGSPKNRAQREGGGLQGLRGEGADTGVPRPPEEGIRVGNRIYTDDEAGRKRAFDAWEALPDSEREVDGTRYSATEGGFDRWLEATGGGGQRPSAAPSGFDPRLSPDTGQEGFFEGLARDTGDFFRYSTPGQIASGPWAQAAGDWLAGSGEDELWADVGGGGSVPAEQIEQYRRELHMDDSASAQEVFEAWLATGPERPPERDVVTPEGEPISDATLGSGLTAAELAGSGLTVEEAIERFDRAPGDPLSGEVQADATKIAEELGVDLGGVAPLYVSEDISNQPLTQEQIDALLAMNAVSLDEDDNMLITNPDGEIFGLDDDGAAANAIFDHVLGEEGVEEAIAGEDDPEAGNPHLAAGETSADIIIPAETHDPDLLEGRWDELQNMAFIVREAAGLGREGAMERHGWGEDVFDMAEQYVKWYSADYEEDADTFLRMQKAAGWSYHNGGGAARGGPPSDTVTVEQRDDSTAGLPGDGGAYNPGYSFNESGNAAGPVSQYAMYGEGLQNSDVTYGITNQPSWWQSYVPAKQGPLADYLGVLNAVMPYLASQDGMAVGSNLYRNAPKEFTAYSAANLNLPVTQDLDIGLFMNKTWTENMITAMDGLREAQGYDAGPGYTWFHDFLNTIMRYLPVEGSRQRSADYEAMLGAIEPMLSSASSQPETAAYVSLARMVYYPTSVGNKGRMAPTVIRQPDVALG